MTLPLRGAAVSTVTRRYLWRRSATAADWSRAGFTQLEHAQNRDLCAFADRFGQSDFGLHAQQGVVGFLERVHFHEPAFAAKTVIRRAGNKCLVRYFL